MSLYLAKLQKLLRILRSPSSFYYYPKAATEHHRLCFSQEGEDMVLARLFPNQQMGFYIDIGAHHPQKYSNTYSFYRKGWRGINIDATPGSMALFKALRPDDINLEVPIAKAPATLTFYLYNNPVLNTFSETIYQQRLEDEAFSKAYWVVEQRQLQARPLIDLLAQHLPSGQAIDFLSIDVEGLDHEILASNDWSTYRPKVVIAEDINSVSLATAQQCPVAKLLAGQGYELIAKTVNSLFFIDSALEVSDNWGDLRPKSS
ncbi:MAG: FkbM family methyltransferase [Cyanobacteria bacterium P01_A01_bin.135]